LEGKGVIHREIRRKEEEMRVNVAWIEGEKEAGRKREEIKKEICGE